MFGLDEAAGYVVGWYVHTTKPQLSQHVTAEPVTLSARLWNIAMLPCMHRWKMI